MRLGFDNFNNNAVNKRRSHDYGIGTFRPITPGYTELKHLEFVFNQQKYQIKFTIPIKLFESKIEVRELCSAAML
jgi:hypothetical protein